MLKNQPFLIGEHLPDCNESDGRYYPFSISRSCLQKITGMGMILSLGLR